MNHIIPNYRLKKLPDSLGNLGNLQSLDLSHNNLKDLPAALGQLTRVRTLNLSHNPKLTRLVKQVQNQSNALQDTGRGKKSQELILQTSFMYRVTHLLPD